MALVKCPDCGRDVSSEAPACPSCGRPTKGALPPVASAWPAVQSVPPSPQNMGSLPYTAESLSPEERLERKRSANKIALTFVILLVGAVSFAYYFATGAARGSTATAPATAPASVPTPFRAPEPVSHAYLVQLKGFQWSKGGFDSVMMVDLTFHNSADVAVKDPTVECNISGPSGTHIGTLTRTIYITIPPHEDHEANKISMGFIDSQASGAGCKVISTAN